MKLHRACFGCVFLALCAFSAASEEKYYIGASAGWSSLSIDSPGVVFDDTDVGAFKVHGGFDVVETFAIEAAYFDLGSLTDTVNGNSFDIEVSGWQLYSVFKYAQNEKLSLLAKAGVVFWTADVSTPGVAINDQDDTDFAFGFGATYASSDRYSWQGEFEWLDITLTDSSWLASVGIQFKF